MKLRPTLRRKRIQFPIDKKLSFSVEGGIVLFESFRGFVHRSHQFKVLEHILLVSLRGVCREEKKEPDIVSLIDRRYCSAEPGSTFFRESDAALVPDFDLNVRCHAIDDASRISSICCRFVEL
jgi:hypothetical protein